MYLYVVRITPDDGSGEGENWDEWFSSLSAAKKRRQEILRAAKDNSEYSCIDPDESIEKITFVSCPKKKLLLKVLNQTGFVAKSESIIK
jgi:hypothetical protein